MPCICIVEKKFGRAPTIVHGWITKRGHLPTYTHYFCVWPLSELLDRKPVSDRKNRSTRWPVFLTAQMIFTIEVSTYRHQFFLSFLPDMDLDPVEARPSVRKSVSGTSHDFGRPSTICHKSVCRAQVTFSVDRVEPRPTSTQKSVGPKLRFRSTTFLWSSAWQKSRKKFDVGRSTSRSTLSFVQWEKLAIWSTDFFGRKQVFGRAIPIRVKHKNNGCK